MVYMSSNSRYQPSSTSSVTCLPIMLQKKRKRTYATMQLFYSVNNPEGLLEVPVSSDLTTLVFMQMDNHVFRIVTWSATFPLTLLNAFVKSMNVTYSRLFCFRHFTSRRLKTNAVSVVLQLALKTHWFSGSTAIVDTILARFFFSPRGRTE